VANPPLRGPITFDCPASYRIAVQGWIDPGWSGRLQGMTIRQPAEHEDPPITTLEGELTDQAALAGVLNALYELHLPVVLVSRLGG
jgi:hypothetical protein